MQYLNKNNTLKNTTVLSFNTIKLYYLKKSYFFYNHLLLLIISPSFQSFISFRSLPYVTTLPTLEWASTQFAVPHIPIFPNTPLQIYPFVPISLPASVHCKETSGSSPLFSSTLLMLGPHWSS